MEITFLGAAGEVTGSCALVRTSGCTFLVDCGMFQGGRDAERKNRGALAFDVRDIDTDLDDAECFGGTDLCEGGIVGTVTVAFP
jgi:predicted metal-dependent RNase